MILMRLTLTVCNCFIETAFSRVLQLACRQQLYIRIGVILYNNKYLFIEYIQCVKPP